MVRINQGTRQEGLVRQERLAVGHEVRKPLFNKRIAPVQRPDAVDDGDRDVQVWLQENAGIYDIVVREVRGALDDAVIGDARRHVQ